MTLLDLVRKRTSLATSLSDFELQDLINADESILHNPYLYDGMDKLVTKLHEFSTLQKEDPSQLLVIDTDYDTDGVMSAAVLSAALDVFNINYRVYIPSMADGYGLNPKAVSEMCEMFETNGHTISMILTADNGTNAIDGVAKANALGITVLVTDHHLGGSEYADAYVIVNPNKQMPDGSVEPYPFKGNAGATVAWKAMMAYASRYAPEQLSLINNLIVFAGIANVSDVMPIIDENHYMVKQSVKELRRLISIRKLYSNDPFGDDNPYMDIANTPYIHYNTVFHGLYDMISLLQKSKDDKRYAANKKPIPLTDDEELIGWYLSPMINAPRRIHATSREAMLALMATRIQQRQDNINSMISMNEEKSKMRNDVTDQLNWDEMYNKYGNVEFVNAQHGIAGLIAGQITSKTGRASIVFALPTNLTEKVYSDNQFDERFDKDTLIIGASARSTNAQPLNIIMARINEMRPDIIAGGGGHAAAAGYSIYYKHLSVFRILFDNVAKQIEHELRAEYDKAVANGEIVPQEQNVIRLMFTDGTTTHEHAVFNINDINNISTFKQDLNDVYYFQQELKPFGKDFEAQTTFEMVIDPIEITKTEYNLNLDFWKTLKFNIQGVDVLTFNVELADIIKERIRMKNPAVIVVTAKLVMNEFRGIVNPQLQIDM